MVPYLNNQPIVVEENFSVRLSWINPACQMDRIIGPAGLGIEIPVNDHSRAIFGNPERFEKYDAASQRKFPGFELRAKGVLLEAGTLVITGANDQRYTGWLQGELGVMGQAQRDRFINELDWKEGVNFQYKASFNPDSDEYCVVGIRNDHFWEGKGAHGNVILNFTDDDDQPAQREEYVNYLGDTLREDSQGLINLMPADYIHDLPPGQPDPNAGKVVSPFLFFGYVLREALRQNRFYIREHPFDRIHQAKYLAVYNNYNIFDITPVTVERPFTTFDRRRNTYVTVIRDVIETTRWQVSDFNYRDLIPKISMKDFLLSIQNLLNVAFVFHPDRTVSIIDREAIPESEAIDLSAYLVGSWEKQEPKKTSLKFITHYDQNDAHFGDEFHDLSDRWQDFRDPVETYQDLLETTSRRNPDCDRTLGQLRYVRSENKIYEYKWTVHNNEESNYSEEQTNIIAWEYVSSGPQYLVYRNGDAVEEIETHISTLQMENGELSALQAGNVNALRNLWADFSMRFLYYLGGTTGSVVRGDASLNWEGDNGLFEKRWKKWARLWANRMPVEADFDFPLGVLDYVRRNITSRFRTRHGDFIFAEMEVEIGVDRIGKTRIKGFKL